jgi:hypothetical protein
MEVDIKVLGGYTIQIIDTKTNMPWSDRETEVPVCKKIDVETSRRYSKSSVESLAHWRFHEPKGVTPKHHKQMKATTRGGRWEENRWPELAEDEVFKVLATFEVPVMNQRL